MALRMSLGGDAAFGKLAEIIDIRTIIWIPEQVTNLLHHHHKKAYFMYSEHKMRQCSSLQLGVEATSFIYKNIQSTYRPKIAQAIKLLYEILSQDNNLLK